MQKQGVQKGNAQSPCPVALQGGWAEEKLDLEKRLIELEGR